MYTFIIENNGLGITEPYIFLVSKKLDVKKLDGVDKSSAYERLRASETVAISLWISVCAKKDLKSKDMTAPELE